MLVNLKSICSPKSISMYLQALLMAAGQYHWNPFKAPVELYEETL